MNDRVTISDVAQAVKVLDDEIKKAQDDAEKYYVKMVQAMNRVEACTDALKKLIKEG